MKNAFFILLLLSTFKISAQNYDLIVTTNGDSIACHIDSISDSDIHFEMMVNNSWVHTYTPKSECINYEFGTIDANTVIFKTSSSYIAKIVTVNYSTQNYDLVVTNKGDSIACYIDSITDSHIYFEIKLRDNWVHTHIARAEISQYKYNEFDGKVLIFKKGSSYIKEIRDASKYFDRNLYSNRYLFAPSAFPMKNELFSYSNITLGLHDLQYGFSDRFSLGFGTTMFFFPIYIMPIYSIPINENSSFAVGDLLMISPYSEDISFFGNLFFGMYSKGSAENNYSVGLGIWTTTKTDVAAETISPAINYSAIIKTGYNTYFITENYAFQYNLTQTAEYNSDPNNYIEEKFLQKKYVLGGISGFRVIGKKYPRNSWQFALTYLFIISEDTPDKYKQPNWDVWGNYNNTQFIPWPILSYTRKF